MTLFSRLAETQNADHVEASAREAEELGELLRLEWAEEAALCAQYQAEQTAESVARVAQARAVCSGAARLSGAAVRTRSGRRDNGEAWCFVHASSGQFFEIQDHWQDCGRLEVRVFDLSLIPVTRSRLLSFLTESLPDAKITCSAK